MVSNKWSADEDICPTHKTSRQHTGFSEVFNQNTYRCDMCDYDDRKQRVLEKRQRGRASRILDKVNKKFLNDIRININDFLKEMYK